MKIKSITQFVNEMAMPSDKLNAYVEYDAIGIMVDKLKLKYNPSTGCYNCDGNVDLYKYYDKLHALEKKVFNKAFVSNGKMTIKFGIVRGNFSLPGDYKKPFILTSLEGCPETVGGNFDCTYSGIESLEGCPKSVGGSFNCGYNKLTSLEGCPESVGNGFFCNDNQLTSLEGCPKTVGGDFYCCFNQLTSLEGCPESIGGHFVCFDNLLTSLEGCPESVGCDFSCDRNHLTSLEGCPKTVGGNFDCGKNKTKFTEDDVRAVCDVKKKIYV